MPSLPLPEHDTASIVLVGSFSPALFQPAWFAAQELISRSDSSESSIQIINNDVCVFETDWFRLEVLQDRWALHSKATPVFESLRDLAVGTFSKLPHERVALMGLNASAHFAVQDRETFDSIGHALAPKETFWKPVLKEPGLVSLTVQGERTDDYKGHIRVRFEPSGLLAPGIFIDINNEYRDESGDSSGWAVKVLRADWDNYRAKVAEIRTSLLTTLGVSK